MPLVIPAGYGTVSVTLKHASVVRPAAVTFGVQLSGISDYVDAVNDIKLAYSSNLDDLHDTEVTIGPVSLRYVPDGGGDPLTVVSTTALTAGLSNADSSPANCALLVKKNTNLGGRRGRGRMFLPWAVSEPNTGEAGNIGASFLASAQTACNNFLAALSTTPMVVLHDSTARTTTHPSSTTTVITETTVAVPSPAVVASLTVDSKLATQRRRMR